MLSFGKIVILIVVAVVAVLGFRLITAISKNANAMEPRRPAAPTASQPRGQAQATKSADLTACPKCGAYSDGRCERPDCGLAR